MRRLLIALILALAGAALPAFANGNTCTCTGACSLNSGTNWSGAASCTDAGGPDSGAGVDDGIIVASGGNLSWDQTGTRTYRNLWVQPGGQLVVTVSPVVMQFDVLASLLGQADTWFAVGGVADDRGIFTSDGKDLTISWIGAGTGFMLLGPQAFATTPDTTTTNVTQVTMRGIERANTFVTNYSRGATAPTPDTNMVDCVDGNTAPVSGATSDTIVFTTGKSQDFWYEVSAYPANCTGAGTANAGFPGTGCTAAGATAECSNTACGGGPCDYQITRNSTGSTPGSVASSSSWSSMVMATGVGGPFRSATPVDNDANGTANGDGTLPGIGDKFVVFKPVLIQGGTNPITNGTVVWWVTGGIDWRYVEVNKASGDTLEDCATSPGWATLWSTGTKILSAEGAMEFVNVHNTASLQGFWEMNYTDDPADVKPNFPVTYKHFYLHDTDPQVGVTCPGQGQQGIGPVIIMFNDDATDLINGVTMDGFHIARWGTGSAFQISSPAANSLQYKNVIIKNFIAHDAPGIAGYGQVATVFNAGSGGTTVDGASIWDIGNATRDGRILQGAGVEASGAVVTWRLSNLFAVNIDSNRPGTSSTDPFGGGFLFADTTTPSKITTGMTLSNSYLYRIVGAAGYGGRWLFNFIKDMNMEDDGTAPCTNAAFGHERGAIMSPVDAYGNVITRAHALSCTENGFQLSYINSASAFTNRTRRIVSNVITNMDTDAAGAIGLTCLLMWNDGVTNSRDVDFYNNLCDLNGNSGPASRGIWSLDPISGKLTAYYNIIRGTSASAMNINNNKDEGYNRFMAITDSPAVVGGNGTGDVDSDAQDCFLDPANFRYWQVCGSPELRRAPNGNAIGPLWWGIRGFSNFHPAVIPLMDADAFKNYDCRACQAAYQDGTPR